MAEVTALANNGHQSIALIGTSTGATAVLHLLLSDTFADLPVKQLILIDPYIEPKDKRINFLCHYFDFLSEIHAQMHLKLWNIVIGIQIVQQRHCTNWLS